MSNSADAAPRIVVSHDEVPLTVFLLTAAGFLPFGALSFAAVLLPVEAHPWILPAQHAYAAVILSFLGGIYWGWEFAMTFVQSRPVSPIRLVIGVLPSIFGWLALFLSGMWTALTLTACFLAWLGYDLWRTQSHSAPRWYPKLRIPVTVAVVVSLIAPVLAG
ncbi:DUF3429 domain-containing protein [Roseibium sp.]|uniref:DUF3429 domain-containing protein n=1 Tax=Roseibium sp. TaxID=1936156 RepID=UPI003D0EBE3B